MSKPLSSESVKKIQDFFNQPACLDGIKPLKDKVAIAIHVGDEGPGTLQKDGNSIKVLPTPPAKPDLTFWVAAKGVDQLTGTPVKEVGDVGIAILQLMAHPDPDFKIKAKVHIGLFDMLRKGYLGVIPLGGPAVMKYLGSKGFGSLGKIKDAISQMKE